jgi:hypothetical protein
VVYAIVFARGADHEDSLVELRLAAGLVRNAWDLGVFAPTVVEAEGPPEVPGLAVGDPYPNPFTDRLAVRFSVPEAMPVRLALYDVLGREVAVLAEGVHEPGEREAVLDASALPAGVYFVRFEAAGERRALPAVRTR